MNEAKVEGKLGKFIKFSTTPKGNGTVSFSVHTPEPGSKNYSWVNCEAWNDVADVLRGAKQGDPISLTGYLKTQEWKDKTTGLGRQKTLIVAQFIDVKKTANQHDPRSNNAWVPEPSDDVGY